LNFSQTPKMLIQHQKRADWVVGITECVYYKKSDKLVLRKDGNNTNVIDCSSPRAIYYSVTDHLCICHHYIIQDILIFGVPHRKGIWAYDLVNECFIWDAPNNSLHSPSEKKYDESTILTVCYLGSTWSVYSLYSLLDIKTGIVKYNFGGHGCLPYYTCIPNNFVVWDSNLNKHQYLSITEGVIWEAETKSQIIVHPSLPYILLHYEDERYQLINLISNTLVEEFQLQEKGIIIATTSEVFLKNDGKTNYIYDYRGKLLQTTVNNILTVLNGALIFDESLEYVSVWKTSYGPKAFSKQK